MYRTLLSRGKAAIGTLSLRAADVSWLFISHFLLRDCKFLMTYTLVSKTMAPRHNAVTIHSQIAGCKRVCRVTHDEAR